LIHILNIRAVNEHNRFRHIDDETGASLH